MSCKHRRLIFVPTEDDPEVLAEICLVCHKVLSVTGPDDPELADMGASLGDPDEDI